MLSAGVEDLVENVDDSTIVESSRLASDDLAQYVLVKGGGVDMEAETAAGSAAAEDENFPQDGNSDEKEPKPGATEAPSLCRIGEQFVMRKLERDRYFGRTFAPVCEVQLSSSGSSSDDEEGDAGKNLGAEFPASAAASRSPAAGGNEGDDDDAVKSSGMGISRGRAIISSGESADEEDEMAGAVDRWGTFGVRRYFPES